MLKGKNQLLFYYFPMPIMSLVARSTIRCKSQMLKILMKCEHHYYTILYKRMKGFKPSHIAEIYTSS